MCFEMGKGLLAAGVSRHSRQAVLKRPVLKIML
jgi:hypothetical protein